MSVTTVLGVPGDWEDEAALRRALVGQGLLFAARRMVEVGSDAGCTVELYRHDPQLDTAYRIAGEGRFSEAQLHAIGAHRTCCYLVDEAAGSAEAAAAIGRLAALVAAAGGLGVKVESTGRADTADRWIERFVRTPSPHQLVDAFVVLVGSADASFYSCGMHNLGWPDVSAPGHLPSHDAARLLDSFCRFQLVDRPTLHPGETFSMG